jgi:UDP-N-acetylmuramate--alanine ligase
MTNVLQRLEDLSSEQFIHMSGIGGSAMNGLAVLLTQRGYRVRGTDPSIDAATMARLQHHGIAVSTIQDGSALSPDTQLVVTTAALPKNHPELVVARNQSIPILKYAAMLGVVMNSNTGIAVAGTHGKTTTTAMIVSALRGAGRDPGFVIGGYVDQFGAGAYGGRDCFVAEACEYDRSFLNLKPSIALITNIEADHLDIYSGIDDIIDSFSAFSQNIRKDGCLVYCAESPAARTLARRFNGRSISYGFKDTAYIATDIINRNGALTFTIQHQNHPVSTVSLKLPGKHNVLNALGAFCAGIQLGCAPESLSLGLSDFAGVQRRFETIGAVNGIHIIDDYAHHPTEIQALLEGARDRFPDARIVVAFQPHQISRTKFFFNDFAASFGLADKVFLPDIYIARDTEAPPEITSEKLAERMKNNHTDAEYTRNFDETAKRAATFLRSGDLFVTVGAGNIYDVAHRVLDILNQKFS